MPYYFEFPEFSQRHGSRFGCNCVPLCRELRNQALAKSSRCTKAWRALESDCTGLRNCHLARNPDYTGAADKAANLVGCKSPHHQLPVFGWLAISDACGGNEACSARIKAPAAQRR